MKKIKLQDFNSLSKKDFGKTVKILPTKLLEYLEANELPIEKEKAIIQIANFLGDLEIKRKEFNSTTLVIPKAIFVNFFSVHTYKQFYQILKENRILTQVSYESGIGYDMNNGIAKQYRLHNEYIDNNDFTIVIFNKKNKKKKIDIDTNVNISFLNTICKEELDYYQVFIKEYEHHNKYNTTLNSLYTRIVRALSLNIHRYIKKGIKVNRIYHSFSNLSRVTRECFNTKFLNIDLKNSQPVLLVYYLIINNLDFENEYKEVCENGMFYELFYDLYDNIENLEDKRKKVKTSIYESLFFSFNTNRRVNKRFKELYPKIWNILNNLNENKIELAGILQNIEAEIFNNLELKYSSKYFTLFDAIYFNDKRDLNSIVKQILEAGNKINLKLTLDIKL